MRRGVVGAVLGLAVALGTREAGAVVIADWTFEMSPPVASAGPFAPEVGAGFATGSHAGATVYSSPVGNGSLNSFSSNGWAVGDYYQFQVSTVGLANLSFAWDQTGSATGPRDFKLSYSTDGVNFADVLNYAVLFNGAGGAAWTLANHLTTYSYLVDLSVVPALSNQPVVDLRLTNTSTSATLVGVVNALGTDRVDNVVITADAVAVPEPLAALMIGGGVVALGLRALSRGNASCQTV